ncbi:MAG: hypothetical protein ACT4NL_16120 [Pseudomarimonas sp.]
MIQFIREVIVDILFEYALRVPGYCLARIFTRNVQIDDFICVFLSLLMWLGVLLVAAQFG